MNPPNTSENTARDDDHVPVTKIFLQNLKGDDLIAWRIADLPGRPSAKERNFPKEFAMGWYAIGYSDELAIGEVKAVRYFAQDLALWRGEDGQARVLDAYCAHYGANMAVAGAVRGNYLECPFHAWRWDGDGSCKEIPYARNIPPQAKRADCVPHWPVAELNGFVLVWYHPERIAPLWEPMTIENAGSPDWTAYDKYEWKIYVAPMNQADNGVDVAHFKYVHGTENVPTYDFVFDGIKKTVNAYPKLNTPRGVVDGQISSVALGSGQGFVQFTGICNTLLVSGVTPIDYDINHILFAFSQPKSEAEGPRVGVARAIIKDICGQLDQDKVILDRMKNIDSPLVCDGDGPFARQRTWANQFFASNGGPQLIKTKAVE
jgi:3-ketosteroid 9alpha-monooxygenase subunit A